MSSIQNEIDLDLFWNSNKTNDFLDYTSMFSNELYMTCPPPSTGSATSSFKLSENKKLIFPESKRYFAIRKVSKPKKSDDSTHSKSDESDLDLEELKYMSSQEKLYKMRTLSREVKKYKCILENISRKFDEKVEKIFKRKFSENSKTTKKVKSNPQVKRITLKRIIRALKNIKYTDNPEPFNSLISNVLKGKEFLSSTNFKIICEEVRALKNTRKTERIRSLSLNSMNEKETSLSKKNSNLEETLVQAVNDNFDPNNVNLGIFNYNDDSLNCVNMDEELFKEDSRFDINLCFNF